MVLTIYFSGQKSFQKWQSFLDFYTNFCFKRKLGGKSGRYITLKIQVRPYLPPNLPLVKLNHIKTINNNNNNNIVSPLFFS